MKKTGSKKQLYFRHRKWALDCGFLSKNTRSPSLDTCAKFFAGRSQICFTQPVVVSKTNKLLAQFCSTSCQSPSKFRRIARRTCGKVSLGTGTFSNCKPPFEPPLSLQKPPFKGVPAKGVPSGGGGKGSKPLTQQSLCLMSIASPGAPLNLQELKERKERLIRDATMGNGNLQWGVWAYTATAATLTHPFGGRKQGTS